MSVTLDTGDIIGYPQDFGGATTATGNITCSASVNLLLAIEANRLGVVASQTPASVTYNSVALTQVGSSFESNTGASYFEMSIWKYVNPPTGTAYSGVCTWTNGPTSGGVIWIPIIAAGQTWTVYTASSVVNNNPAVTATGVAAGGLYLGAAFNQTTTQTTAGTNQSNLYQLSDLNTTLSCLSVDTIPGADGGAFSWTNGGTDSLTAWNAFAFAVNPPTTGGGGGANIFLLGV